MRSMTTFGTSKNCFEALPVLETLVFLALLIGACERPDQPKTVETVEMTEAPAEPFEETKTAEAAEEVDKAEIELDMDMDGVLEDDRGADPVVQAAGLPHAVTLIQASEQVPSTNPTQVLMQQKKILGRQEAEVDDYAKNVAQIRWALIARRLAPLEKQAREQGWESKPPQEDSAEWDLYAEWQYILLHQKALKRGLREESNGVHNLPVPMIKRNKQPLKKAFRPDWAQ